MEADSRTEPVPTKSIASREFVSWPLIRENSLEKRRYQVELAQIAIEQNTLAVLPTGLGKTAIALLSIAHYLSKNKDNQCLILAPTRVLVHQHYSFLRDHLELTEDQIGVLTGEDTIGDRKAIWEKKRVVCATPQVMVADRKSVV